MEDKEKWRIEYCLLVNGRRIKVGEDIYFKKGYYDDVRKFWSEEDFKRIDMTPVWSVKPSRNIIKLYPEGDEIELPRNRRENLDGGRIICNESNPLRFIAPDGRIYEAHF